MNKFRVNRLAVALSVAIATLSGCAATREANETFDSDNKAVKNAYAGATPQSASSIADPTQDKRSNFARVTRNWVNPVPLPKNTMGQNKERLPAIFQKEVSLTMPGRVSLIEVLSELQRANGIKVDLNQDIYDSNIGEASIIGSGSANNNNAKEPITISDFVFRGTLDSALDLLASKANVSWRWTGNSIEMYRYETKSYNITLLAGQTTSTSEVNLDSESDTTAGTTGQGTTSAGSASSSGKQGVTRSASLDSWGDVKNFILSLMSPNGSLAIMESTGLITVKDTPDVQRRVAQAVDELNKLIGTQIYINVDVYAVTRDASDDYGLDWNLAWSSTRNEIGYQSGPNSSASNNFNIGVLTGPFSGTNAVIKALSTLGKTSVVNQFQITTLNGQPTPIGNNRKIPYISGIEVTANSSESSQQSVTTSSIYQGISMSIIPKVQPNGKILLEYAMNLSDFEGFTDFSTGTGTNSVSLSLPTTTLKNILQRASLKSGQALVLSGFKQTVADSNTNGVGSPSNFLFGGGSKAGKKEQYLVITVTPYVSQD